VEEIKRVEIEEFKRSFIQSVRVNEQSFVISHLAQSQASY